MADLVQYYGTGRRKSAIARVFLRPGSGNFQVNGKGLETYFVTEQQRVSAKRSLVLTELTGSFDVVTTVQGGGVSAQADAVKMGIARALLEFNAELRKTLKTKVCSPAMRAARSARSTDRRAPARDSNSASANLLPILQPHSWGRRMEQGTG